MPAPLELYRAWERESPATTCHVLIIERGDGSAAKRLTLTDKPFVAKGVSGTRYHHTYPAPIQCIISELETTENKDGATFAPVLLANGEGRLDAILDEVIEDQPFVLYRGDTRWSFLEEDFPERFLQIGKGVVEKVRFLDGGAQIELQLSPARYNLEQTVGLEEDVYGVGILYNCPVVLVDAPNLKYRCNTVRSDPTYFEVFDNGVQLTLTTDYVIVNETSALVEDAGGAFYGKFQLLAAPSGTVTVNQNYTTDETEGLGIWLMTRAVKSFFFPSYPEYTTRTSVYSQIKAYGIWWKPDGTELYVCGVKNGGHERHTSQYSLSSAWDLSTLSYTTQLSLVPQMGSSNGTPAPKTIQISDDGTQLYVLSTAGVFFQYELSTPWDLDTGTYVATFDLATVGITDECEAMYIHDNTVFVVEVDQVYRLTMTAGDISTLTGLTFALSLEVTLGAGVAVSAIDFSADGKKFYYLDVSQMLMIRQLDLPTAWDLSETVNPERSFFYQYYNITMRNADLLSFRMATGGDKFYTLYNYGSTLYTVSEFDGITGADLPVDLVRIKNFETKLGVYYTSETTKGTVLTDMATSLACDFYVSRNGVFSLIQERDPSDAFDDGELVFQIALGDFVGARGEHIRHIETLPPIYQFSVSYGRNFSPLSESESAGSLTTAQKTALATEEYFSSFPNPNTAFADAPSLSISTFCTTATDAGDVTAVRAYFRFEPRFYFEFDTRLSWSSLVDRFDVGRLVQIDGDVKHSLLQDNDYLLVTGRRINWTKNMQTLTVVK